MRKKRFSVDMIPQLGGRQSPPASALVPKIAKTADFHGPLANAVLFDCGAIGAFQTKAHGQERHKNPVLARTTYE